MSHNRRITMALSRGVVATLQFVFILEFPRSINVYAYDTCEEIGICDKVENYPTELVKGLIEELKNKNTLFYSDEVDVDLHTRFNAFREELCEYTPQNYVPQRAKDALGIMRIIINDKEKPIQKFNIATCNYKDAKCNGPLGFLPNYRGVCIQKYALREMIYVDDKNLSATGYFRVPICCSCELVRSF